MAMSVNDLLDRLETVPDVQKYGVVGGIILLMVGLFYYFVFSPNIETINQQLSEIQKLDSEIQTGEAMKAKERELEAEVAKLNTQLTTALEYLPDEKRISQFIKTIEDIAVSGGLSVEKFLPSRQQGGGKFKGIAPVQLTVLGNYHAIGKFYEKLANEKRIVNIAQMNLNGRTSKGGYSLNARITVHALFFKN